MIKLNNAAELRSDVVRKTGLKTIFWGLGLEKIGVLGLGLTGHGLEKIGVLGLGLTGLGLEKIGGIGRGLATSLKLRKQ